MEEVISDIFEGLKIILSSVGEILFKYGMIILWALFGIVVIAISFLANFLYPFWEKWGENLKK